MLVSCSDGVPGAIVAVAVGAVAIAVLAGVRAHRPSSAGLWQSVGAALAIHATSRLASVAMGAFGVAPEIVVGASVVGIVLCCAIAAAGLCFLVTGGSGPRDATVDGFIVATAAGLAVWQLVIHPLAVAGGDEGLAWIVTSAAVIASGALLRIGFGAGRNTAGRLLVTGGLVGMVGLVLATIPDPHAVVVLAVALAWGAALVLVAVAALHPSLSRFDQRAVSGSSRSRVRFLLVVGSVTVAAPVAMIDLAPETPLNFALETVGVLFVVVGGAVRLAGLLRADERAEARIRRQLELQEAVAELGRRAVGTPSAQAVVDTVVALSAELLAADAATMVETVPGEEDLRYRSAVGFPGRTVAMDTVRRDGTIAGAALASGKAVVVGDLVAENRYQESVELRALGLVSGVVVPVHGRETIYGLLAVFSRTVRRFTEQEVAFLEMAANVLAGTLERDGVESLLRQQALQDPLTGLPNRRHVLERLDAACVRARGDGPTVIAIEVDGIDVVHDTLGNDAGDALIQAVAERLATCFAVGDTLGRYADATFVGIWTGPPAARDDLVAIVSAALSPPFAVSEGEVFVRPTIGTAVGGPGVHAQELLRQADLALLWAKREGGWQAVFAREMEAAAQHRLQRETDLRHALERDEFVCHYQPQVDMDSGRVVGLEALVRWHHPREGLLAPGAFVEIAEQTGLVAALDRWVLRAACEQVAAWTAAGTAAPRVSVNMSAASLQHGDLPHRLAAVLADTGVRPDQIELEITESGVMQRPDEVIATLRALRDTGVRIAVDDFGTGYSSLSYLQRFPVDTLKIDRSFVRTLGGDLGSSDSGILAAIVSVGRHLGLDLVAEGVETGAQRDVLRALGCDVAQGYFYARPLPVEELVTLLQATQEAEMTS